MDCTKKDYDSIILELAWLSFSLSIHKEFLKTSVGQKFAVATSYLFTYLTKTSFQASLVRAHSLPLNICSGRKLLRESKLDSLFRFYLI